MLRLAPDVAGGDRADFVFWLPANNPAETMSLIYAALKNQRVRRNGVPVNIFRGSRAAISRVCRAAVAYANVLYMDVDHEGGFAKSRGLYYCCRCDKTYASYNLVRGHHAVAHM